MDIRTRKLLDMDRAGEAREITPDEKVPFECGGCGGCCHHVEVPLTDHDLRQIAAHFQVTPRDFMARYGEFTAWNGFLPVAKLKFLPNGSCPFLKPNGHCAVHPARPLACRLFPYARIATADGRSRWFKLGESRHSGCPSGPDTPRRTVTEYIESQQAAPALAAEDAFITRCREILARSGPFDLLEELMAFRSRVRELYGDVW